MWSAAIVSPKWRLSANVSIAKDSPAGSAVSSELVTVLLEVATSCKNLITIRSAQSEWLRVCSSQSQFRVQSVTASNGVRLDSGVGVERQDPPPPCFLQGCDSMGVALRDRTRM